MHSNFYGSNSRLVPEQPRMAMIATLAFLALLTLVLLLGGASYMSRGASK